MASSGRLTSYSAAGAAPLSSDPVFKREFTKAVITGAGALLGLALMALLLKKIGVISEIKDPLA